MRELSKRNRCQAVKFDPSTNVKKKNKKKRKLGTVQSIEGTRLDQTNKAHRVRSTKMIKEKKRAVRKKGRKESPINTVMKKGAHGHFVMSDLCRLEKTNKAPPKLNLLSATPHRVIKLSPISPFNSLCKPVIPTPKPTHSLSKPLMLSLKPDPNVVIKPLMPSIKPAHFLSNPLKPSPKPDSNIAFKQLISSIKPAHSFLMPSPKPDPNTLSRPLIPSIKPAHPLPRPLMISPNPDHNTLSRPLIPTPKPSVYERVYSNLFNNVENTGSSHSRCLLSPNSLKCSYAVFANSPLMQTNTSRLSAKPVTLELESPNILNTLLANSPLLQNNKSVTVKLNSFNTLKRSYSLMASPLLQKNISNTPVAGKEESPKICNEHELRSSLVISPFIITNTPKSTTDLLEYLFNPPHLLSLISSRDNKESADKDINASSKSAPSLESLTKASFPLILKDPLMPDIM